MSNDADNPPASHAAFSEKATAVPPIAQCNTAISVNPFDRDCDLKLSIIGGIEESAQSSSQTATTPFLRVFTQSSIVDKNKFWLNDWGYVRLLGAPTTSSTNGVVSVVSNPSGALTAQTFSSIGTSLDYMLGLEWEFVHPGLAGFSISAIAGFGGTTPLQANTLALAFTAPPFGSVECQNLYPRFMNQFAADNISLGTPTNTTGTTPSCLVNTSSPTSTSSGTTYAPITTIGFSNQDRTSFLGKEVLGIRTITRFKGTGNTACGDSDPANKVGPCERGVIDFTVGQDASITGGQMRHYIFKIDAVHPLPVAGVSILYIFGSASMRLAHNVNYPPLILQSANTSTLSGTGTSSVPNAATAVLSLVQPNRDYYRFGIGINIFQIFTKLAAASSAGSGNSSNQ